MYKILILIVSSDTYPSVRNRKIIENTWVSLNSKEEVYFYKAGNDSYFSSKNEITVKAGSSSIDIGKKNIEVFDFVLKNFKFDYLFRTTTTSYVNINQLKKFINEKIINKEDIYCGKILETKDHKGLPIQFVSGAGILFDQKLLKKIVQNKHKIDFELWDDVGLGKLIGELNVNPIEGQRYDITGNIFKQKVDVNQYHYRCRVDNHYGYPRFLEYYVLKYLHKFVQEEKVNFYIKKIFSLIFEISKMFYIQYPLLKLFNLLKKMVNYIFPKKVIKIIKFKFKKLNEIINLRYFKY